MAPTVLLVHGFWEGPSVFAKVSSLLNEQGFATETLTLPSLGAQSPGNPGMKDDIAAIRKVVSALADDGKEVLLLLHSGAGFLGSNAIEGLDVADRRSQKQPGGVTKIVFLTAAVFPEGFTHGPLPFSSFEGGAMWCATPEKVLFNDLDPTEAAEWTKALQCQPAQGWDDTVTYCGWRKVPSVYILCKRDQAIPLELQKQLAASASSEVEEIDAGHMAMLSQPGEVARIVVQAAA